MRRKLLRSHGSPIKRLRSKFQIYSVNSTSTSLPLRRKPSGDRFSDLELLDRMLTSLESRRNKALGTVAEYRASLGQQLRESADRIVNAKGVLRLEDAASNRSTAA